MRPRGTPLVRAALRLAFTALLLAPGRLHAYSVQTHEQLIDLEWTPSIVPLLRARFPGITDAQLAQAHAYAYGGCAIQDIGYYPFGNAFFSDLTHYVRPGDFVRSLLRNAKDANELAFAVGALSHYIGDTTGHAEATNPAVAAEFPALSAKYGPVVTYEQNPHAHVRTEFAFDINEISKHRFAPSAYLAHIGIKVSRDLLGRAFFETYGLRLEKTLGGGHRPTFKAYRFAVRSFLPRIAYAETVLHRKHMPVDSQDAEFDALKRSLAQSEFENGWDQYRKKAGIGTYTLAGILFILPPIGPISEAKIKGPTEATERLYVASVDRSVARMHKVIGDLESGNIATITTDLENRDLDTGAKVKPGAYHLTDYTYAKLLGEVTEPTAGKIPTGLVADIEQFYANPEAPNATKKEANQWAKVQTELVTLKTRPTVPEP